MFYHRTILEMEGISHVVRSASMPTFTHILCAAPQPLRAGSLCGTPHLPGAADQGHVCLQGQLIKNTVSLVMYLLVGPDVLFPPTPHLYDYSSTEDAWKGQELSCLSPALWYTDDEISFHHLFFWKQETSPFGMGMNTWELKWVGTKSYLVNVTPGACMIHRLLLNQPRWV